MPLRASEVKSVLVVFKRKVGYDLNLCREIVSLSGFYPLFFLQYLLTNFWLLWKRLVQNMMRWRRQKNTINFERNFRVIQTYMTSEKIQNINMFVNKYMIFQRKLTQYQDLMNIKMFHAQNLTSHHWLECSTC